MRDFNEYLGELLGTFILVFIGCGSVALDVIYGTFGSLTMVALVWGAGVALAIFATRNYSPAHLNPAVSVAMWFSKRYPLKKLGLYVISQFIGALLAGVALYLIFASDLAAFEIANSIVRGQPESAKSAMMFGEFYPNPGFPDIGNVSSGFAVLMEGLGTFTLVFVIFLLTDPRGIGSKLKIKNLIPILIGLTVTAIICVVAPYTQAGLNPARDFGPRLVAYFAGWNSAAFPDASIGFFTIYIIAPIAGGILAFRLHSLFFRKGS